MNYLTVKNPVKVVDKYQFNESEITKYNDVEEVHAVHRQTKDDVTLRSIELQGKKQHLYDYMQQELTILKWLNHQSIVRCQRIFKTRNHLYFVYDYLPGYPLAELIQGGCNFQRVLEVVNGLLKVLAYLNQRDITHGQLDPQSVVLFGGSKIMLRNFGYGMQMVKDPMPLPSFHSSRKTNKYTPPEIQDMILTQKSDIYSLGSLIVDLLESVRGPSQRETQFGHHIALYASKMQQKKPEDRPDMQDVVDYFRNRPYEKKIVTFKIPSMKRKSTKTQQNTAKLKLKLYPNNELCPSTLDSHREGRKILAKRNFQKFLLEVAHLCGRLPLSACQSLTLGVLMTKKAVILASQLLKLIETGSGDNLRIDERTMSRICNHDLFKQLETMITREKQELMELFELLSNAIKQNLKKDDHSKLFNEIAVESVCASFFKHSLYGWLGDAIEWLKNEHVRPQKTDLVLICALVFLLQYPSLEEGFSVLCGENGVDLWDEPLFEELGGIADCNLQKLIILEGESKGLCQQILSSGGSSRVSRQKK